MKNLLFALILMPALVTQTMFGAAGLNSDDDKTVDLKAPKRKKHGKRPRKKNHRRLDSIAKDPVFKLEAVQLSPALETILASAACSSSGAPVESFLLVSTEPHIKTRKYIEKWMQIQRDMHHLIPHKDFLVVLRNFERYTFKRDPKIRKIFHENCRELKALIDKTMECEAVEIALNPVLVTTAEKNAAITKIVEIFVALWSVRAKYINPKEHELWATKMEVGRLFAYAYRYLHELQ